MKNSRGRIVKSMVLALGISFPLMSEATPDHSITVDEVYLGANRNEYAVLRTESDNLCSYYQSRRHIWLDVVPKNGTPDSKPVSRLLLDETRHVSVEDGKPTPSESHFKDEKFTLADLVDRFSISSLMPWSADWRKDLEFDPKTGRTMFKSQCLVEGTAALAKRFDTTAEEREFQLLDVAEDGGCIYLTIRMGMDENRETRILCIPPAVSRNVHALMDLDPLYLSAGSFKSKEEAFAKVGTLEPGKAPYYWHWEVWAVWHEEAQVTEYEVVLGNSKEKIDDYRLMTDGNHYPVHLLPVTSDGFRERFPIPEIEATSR